MLGKLEPNSASGNPEGNSRDELLVALETVIKELDHWHNWQLAVNDKYPKSEGSIHTRAILLKADTVLQNAKGNIPVADKNH